MIYINAYSPDMHMQGMVGTIAEIEMPAAEFALYETFARLDGIACEIERVVAHDTDRIMPFVWIRNGSYENEEVTTALTDDSTIDTFELLVDLDDEGLYRMGWIDRVQTLVQILIEEEGTIMAASGEDGTWSVRVLFAERDALSRTYDYCETHGLTFDVRRIYELDEGRQGRFGLTDKQHTTLVTAFESGYYKIPRETTAGDLAIDLDISHQALSELLRRGHESLVRNTIILGRGEQQRRLRKA